MPAASNSTPLWMSRVASPPSSTIWVGPPPVAEVEGALGARPVLLQRLALPGEDRHAARRLRRAAPAHRHRGGGVVLGREDVAARPADVGAEVDQRLDQHRGLDGHVERAGDPLAGERPQLARTRAGAPSGPASPSRRARSPGAPSRRARDPSPGTPARGARGSPGGRTSSSRSRRPWASPRVRRLSTVPRRPGHPRMHEGPAGGGPCRWRGGGRLAGLSDRPGTVRSECARPSPATAARSRRPRGSWRARPPRPGPPSCRSAPR